MRRVIRQGQSTVEYAVLVAVVVGALIAMQIYMKRGVQDKLRSATDDIGGQFSPTAYKANFQTVQKRATRDTLHTGDQGIGGSQSVTVTEGGIENISSSHKTRDGTTEQLTDDQANDSLFKKTP